MLWESRRVKRARIRLNYEIYIQRTPVQLKQSQLYQSYIVSLKMLVLWL